MTRRSAAPPSSRGHPHAPGPERGAIGAVKEALFWDDVPGDEAAARAFVQSVVAEALAEDE